MSGSTLAFDVRVRNLTGHKFPTGYPARRTWLHVMVRDRDAPRGVRVWRHQRATGRSPATTATRIRALRTALRRDLRTADQVQIYEPILGDPAGRPTTGLLTATQYLKDNRLLPRGFDKATAHADVGVYGDASRDADFTGDGDRVRYRVSVAGGGPFAIEVELRYQSIGYRWARNLEKYDAPEPKRFVGYYRDMSNVSSLVVSKAAATAK